MGSVGREWAARAPCSSLAGTLAPDAGASSAPRGLKVVTFDQHREPLDLSMLSGGRCANPASSSITRDKPIHVAGWAERFLFRQGTVGRALGQLSGGEQSRVMIARIMLRPADVLLLDEPTNDLDLNSLEVLETSLMDFAGRWCW